MTPSIAYLSRLCRRWGGELLLLSTREFRHMSRVSGRSTHPAGAHAIDRGARLVIVNQRHANPGTIIHEMGHVFLEEADPFYSDEPEWLGWEITLARQARCFQTWSKQNAGYRLEFEGDSYLWEEMRPCKQRGLIMERIEHAKGLGIVSRVGSALCTRKTP